MIGDKRPGHPARGELDAVADRRDLGRREAAEASGVPRRRHADRGRPPRVPRGRDPVGRPHRPRLPRLAHGRRHPRQRLAAQPAGRRRRPARRAPRDREPPEIGQASRRSRSRATDRTVTRSRAFSRLRHGSHGFQTDQNPACRNRDQSRFRAATQPVEPRAAQTPRQIRFGVRYEFPRTLGLVEAIMTWGNLARLALAVPVALEAIRPRAIRPPSPHSRPRSRAVSTWYRSPSR